jgi:cytochrome P450
MSDPAVEESPPLSLYHLLDPEVLANPYPLYRRLREEAPVHWDPYLHAWVVTRYEDASMVLRHYLAARTPDPERLAASGGWRRRRSPPAGSSTCATTSARSPRTSSTHRSAPGNST